MLQELEIIMNDVYYWSQKFFPELSVSQSSNAWTGNSVQLVMSICHKPRCCWIKKKAFCSCWGKRV